VTIQLRYLQTVLEIGNEQNSTIVFPLPIELVQPPPAPVSARSTVSAPGSSEHATSVRDGVPNRSPTLASGD
jgi:hypothetical protein